MTAFAGCSGDDGDSGNGGGGGATNCPVGTNGDWEGAFNDASDQYRISSASGDWQWTDYQLFGGTDAMRFALNGPALATSRELPTPEEPEEGEMPSGIPVTTTCDKISVGDYIEFCGKSGSIEGANFSLFPSEFTEEETGQPAIAMYEGDKDIARC